ncbi:cyclin-dependent protein kinase inhibitor SMR1-like [Malania oleifera]|uniref:cyclin-dependent protein kinase inhibitor SMR1-like n=1 Tax=Malania oleifera TaxID=397392 RepID=UPI0025AEC371|nr:cyclin-dependent protein kinase inhibitor SMR1-like [Malania oleifera]
MSMDLQLRLELSTLRPPPIRVRTPESSHVAGDTSRTVDTGDLQSTKDCEQSMCRTPTSEEHKIPAVLSCPRAPRKRRAVVSCKRRLSWELEFCEIVQPEQLDELFQSSFKAVAGAKKRRVGVIK